MEDSSRSQDEGHRLSLLPSAFSRGHAYQRMSSGSDIDLADVAPARTYSPLGARGIHATPPMDAPSYLQPPRRPSAISPVGTGDVGDAGDDGAQMASRIDPTSYSTPAFVITHQDETPAQTEGTTHSSRPTSERQTRFTELLKRSLTSSGDKAGDPLSDPAGHPYLGASSARSSLLLPVDDRDDRQRDYETDRLSKRYGKTTLAVSLFDQETGADLMSRSTSTSGLPLEKRRAHEPQKLDIRTVGCILSNINRTEWHMACDRDHSTPIRQIYINRGSNGTG